MPPTPLLARDNILKMLIFLYFTKFSRINSVSYAQPKDSIALKPKFYRFIKSNKWFVEGLLLSLLTLTSVTVTLLADAVYFNDPRHKNVVLEAWMTPRYVTLSYELPRPIVLELLGIEEGTKFPRRLDRLAESLGITLEELTEKVRTAKKAYLENPID